MRNSWRESMAALDASVSYEDTHASLPMASTGMEVAGLSPNVSTDTDSANGRHVWQ